VRANQIAEFKYVTLIENMLTKQWHLEKALDVAGGRMDYEKLLPKQRTTVEAFIFVFMRLPAGYKKSFCHGYLPSYSTICSVQCLRGSASLPHTKHRINTAP